MFLAARSVYRLAPLAVHDSRSMAHQQKFSFVSALVARRTETIQSIHMPVAGLLVVLEGVKKLGWAGSSFSYLPGQAFALPTRAYVDVVNELDPPPPSCTPVKPWPATSRCRAARPNSAFWRSCC